MSAERDQQGMAAHIEKAYVLRVSARGAVGKKNGRIDKAAINVWNGEGFTTTAYMHRKSVRRMKLTADMFVTVAAKLSQYS